MTKSTTRILAAVLILLSFLTIFLPWLAQGPFSMSFFDLLKLSMETGEFTVGELIGLVMLVTTILGFALSLKGKKLGMLNGVIFDQLLMSNREGFSQEDMSYYNSNAETIGALQAKKVDAMITDQSIAELAVNILRAAVPGPANLQRAATGCRGTYHAVFGSCRA